ncbi:phosphate signaling complex PhoU family protein, partial [Angelakisella massiliensis]
EMAQTAVKMVRQSIQAYVGENMELARQVLEMDDIVDGLFIKVRQDLLQTIRSREDSGGEALDLLMAAKYLERIGDHATNIAEWVIFSASGIYKDAPLLGEAQT